jgi:hypothetical protein
MKVKKYIIEIYDSPLDYTHEFKRPIVAYLKDIKNNTYWAEGTIAKLIEKLTVGGK